MARQLADSYLRGLLALAAEVTAAGAACVFGGVYPNGFYRDHHMGALRNIDGALREAGYTVVDFLGVLEHGDGLWKPGMVSNPANQSTVS
eukprot:SAG11_NODE_721_length_7539_cov_32.292473_7_plen_90_part_00